MRVPIAVVPRLFVTIGVAGRNQAIEHFGQIAFQSWFEFNRPNCTGATDVEDLRYAGLNSTVGNNLRDACRQVMHVAVTRGSDFELLLVDHDAASMSPDTRPGEGAEEKIGVRLPGSA